MRVSFRFTRAHSKSQSNAALSSHRTVIQARMYLFAEAQDANSGHIDRCKKVSSICVCQVGGLSRIPRTLVQRETTRPRSHKMELPTAHLAVNFQRRVERIANIYACNRDIARRILCLPKRRDRESFRCFAALFLPKGQKEVCSFSRVFRPGRVRAYFSERN